MNQYRCLIAEKGKPQQKAVVVEAPDWETAKAKAILGLPGEWRVVSMWRIA